MLSGGEPFMERELLCETVDCIMERKFPSLGTLSVQTVGYWARNKKYAEKVLGHLIDLGVNKFAIFGRDAWHEEGGLNLKFQDNIVDVLKNKFHFEEEARNREENIEQILDRKRRHYTVRSTTQVVSVGRAAGKAKKSELRKTRVDPICHCGNFLVLHRGGYYYIVNFVGETHFCVWQTTTPLGNAIEESIPSMLKRAKKQKLFQILNTGNILDLATDYFGLPKNQIVNRINEIGRCAFHQELSFKHYQNKFNKPIMLNLLGEG